MIEFALYDYLSLTVRIIRVAVSFSPCTLKFLSIIFQFFVDRINAQILCTASSFHYKCTKICKQIIHIFVTKCPVRYSI